MRTFAGNDVLGRDASSARVPRKCVYCDRSPAAFEIVPEPTDHSTYREVWRVLCWECAQTYKGVPYGFRLEH